MQKGTFSGSGKDLVAALKEEGSFQRSGSTLVGMVKAADDGKNISFTMSDCDSWVDIPAEMITNAEMIAESRCKDHSHPVFEITLQEEGKDPASKMLLALLAQGNAPRYSDVNPAPDMGGLPTRDFGGLGGFEGWDGPLGPDDGPLGPLGPLGGHWFPRKFCWQQFQKICVDSQYFKTPWGTWKEVCTKYRYIPVGWRCTWI